MYGEFITFTTSSSSPRIPPLPLFTSVDFSHLVLQG